MNEEIKEILKVDKQLLDKIENILATELSPNEYDIFYNYFNEIRKPNILIDIKDVSSVKKYITNLQEKNQKLNKVIDGLEKWLKEDEEKAATTWEMGRCFNMFDILNKLTELKKEVE